jgi:hypothetical protein
MDLGVSVEKTDLAGQSYWLPENVRIEEPKHPAVSFYSSAVTCRRDSKHVGKSVPAASRIGANIPRVEFVWSSVLQA